MRTIRFDFLGLVLAAAVAAPVFACASDKPAPPPEEVAKEPAPEETCAGRARLQGLEFGPGDAKLDAGDKVMLDAVAAAVIERCTTQTIVVEGHTDASGSPKQNQALSLRRAQAVRAYLVKKGFPADRIKAEGYGSSRPLSDDPSPMGQAMNRRVALVVESPVN